MSHNNDKPDSWRVSELPQELAPFSLCGHTMQKCLILSMVYGQNNSYSMRQHPHCAGEIWKRSFSLRFGLPSTLVRHENGAFGNRPSNGRNLKTPAFRFRVDGKHFENRAFRKRWRHDNHVITLSEFSSNTSPKWPVIVPFLNSSDLVWTGAWKTEHREAACPNG